MHSTREIATQLRSDRNLTHMQQKYTYIIYIYIILYGYRYITCLEHLGPTQKLPLRISRSQNHRVEGIFLDQLFQERLAKVVAVPWEITLRPCCVLRDLFQSHPVTSSHSHHPEVWIAVAVKARSINFPLLQLLNCRLQRFLRQSKLHI